MNRFNRWLVLKLINRKIVKIERKAANWLLMCNSAGKREQTLLDAIDDPQEYQRLRYLRENITNINAPWQGSFAHWWTVWPKDTKFVQPFPVEVYVPRELKPLSEDEQAWADMDDETFFESLDQEPYEPPVIEEFDPVVAAQDFASYTVHTNRKIADNIERLNNL